MAADPFTTEARDQARNQTRDQTRPETRPRPAGAEARLGCSPAGAGLKSFHDTQAGAS